MSRRTSDELSPSEGTIKVSIVEWRHGGHRLAYIRAIVQLAAEERIGVELVTFPGIEATPEFLVHLGDAHRAGEFAVISGTDLEDPRGFRRALYALKFKRRFVILPEADRYLLHILWVKIVRRLPLPIAVIIMRPPQNVQPGLRGIGGRLYKSYKFALLIIMSQLPSIDLLLLEDPLAHGRLRVWRQPILRNPRHRLDDPCDLVCPHDDRMPTELDAIDRFDPFVAVIGAIDARKRLPLVIDGWARCDLSRGAGLVIAGKQSEDVREWLSRVDIPSNVHVLDRYLSQAEISTILGRSRGIFALHDGGISSSLLVAAGVFGRWAITLNGTRPAAVAAINRFGMSCDATPDSVAQAIGRVLQGDPPRGVITAPSGHAFASTVLRRCLSDRHRT